MAKPTDVYRHHRERIIRKRLRTIRAIDGYDYERPGVLAKTFPMTCSIWCDHDWMTWSRGDSIRRNRMVKRILDREQLSGLQEVE